MAAMPAAQAPDAPTTGVAVPDASPTDRYPADQATTREAQAMLFFAYRDFTNAADMVLEELGLGRAHHRALHFIGRHPGITVSDLLVILRITKQALARVLNTLVDDGYVAQAPGEVDRRQRLLRLTEAGIALERRLSENQRARVSRAYREAGAEAVAGYQQVLLGIINEADRTKLRGG